MIFILEEVLKRVQNQESVALVTIVDVSGSSPESWALDDSK